MKFYSFRLLGSKSATLSNIMDQSKVTEVKVTKVVNEAGAKNEAKSADIAPAEGPIRPQLRRKPLTKNQKMG